MRSGTGLARILAAQGLSSLGTSVSTVALAVMVFDLTGSVLHMGGVLAASTLPLMVMSLLGGALLDRYDGRRLMVVSDLARAALILLMPFAASRSVGFIYAVSAAMGAFAAVFNPSQVKVVGDITPETGLVRANSYLSMARDGAELGGYLAGGILVASIGYMATFAVDSLSYLISALLLQGLSTGVPRMQSQASLLALMRESPQVLRFIWESPALRTNLLVAAFPMAVIMMSLPNAYGLALQVYERGPKGLAAMEIMTSLGWIIGGVLASRINYKGDRNKYVMVSLAVMALCFFVVGIADTFWLAVAFLAVGAVANVGVIVGSMTLFQEIDDRPDKGRLIAVRAGVGQLGMTGGLLAGGLLGAALGITHLFLVAGAAALGLGLIIYLPYEADLKKALLSPVKSEGVP